MYSQYPATANHYLGVYQVDANGSLCLLRAAVHDYYFEALEDMRAAADSGDIRAIAERAWSLIYPHANPYAKEMCVVLLKAGLEHVEPLVASGVPPEEALEWFEDLYDIPYDLTNGPLHRAIVDPEDYPELVDVDLPEYVRMLSSLAQLFEDAGNEEMSTEVRDVLESLRDS
ncbi:hypothetical protein GF402_01290 [Candidatus Fermentibacteria bacterium]|nr:hypothetical protein [Candidatus Fermentibacteria bacterium]